jgi:hypothetical protein
MLRPTLVARGLTRLPPPSRVKHTKSNPRDSAKMRNPAGISIAIQPT